mmetsp:Transcript_28941/g.35197  ORF Transcript_28941/g.35197 Transcript_28941/m.35197 type:complete len:89 (+) Transcript_28941:376-642(+)
MRFLVGPQFVPAIDAIETNKFAAAAAWEVLAGIALSVDVALGIFTDFAVVVFGVVGYVGAAQLTDVGNVLVVSYVREFSFYGIMMRIG